ncbi:hypothetical protein [Vagococcus hydrophili]|uniref:Uncharacterized protein n=1 Tax=Vagococcus hydrophili TaxID=2714947 RepID=A0A6G8ARG1_9ENTE|nr:hypothetical protein [Vagococcus hydrophili]QIL47559.1 hypothetical protein G7082_02910 [Vagococcus hydrophili]
MQSEKYKEFYRLKRSITNKLASIQYFDRMDSKSENFVEDICNSQTFQEAMEEMREAEKLVNELKEYEANEGKFEF